MQKNPTIREVVAARAAKLGLTAYAIAKRTEGVVSQDTVRRFLDGRGEISTGRLDAVLHVLGLVVATA